jgi:hypothetical protein
MTVSLNGTNGITFYDASTQNTAATGFGFKNRIINGAMNVWQRGTSFSISTTTVTYTADRWGIYQPSGTGTITQDTDVPTGFKYSLKAVGAGTDVIQRIESANVSDLSGATVTVSFWLKQTVGAGSGSMSVNLQYANVADNFSAPVSISTSTITATSSWAQYSVTFASLPSGSTNGLAINIYPTSSGSSSTYFVTGVQLEKGSTATSFDYRPYGTELALCQRYFQRIGDTSNPYTYFGSGTFVSTTSIRIFVPFMVRMRTSPTLEASGAAATFAGVDAASALDPITSLSLDNANPTSAAMIFNTTTARTAGWGALIIGNGSTSACLFFTAEL